MPDFSHCSSECHSALCRSILSPGTARRSKIPEAVDDVLVVEQKDLLVGQGHCCQLQAPGWQVDWLQAEDAADNFQNLLFFVPDVPN